MNDKTLKTSRAQLEANKRYQAKNIKRLTIKAKINEMESIKDYAKVKGMSTNGFILQSIRYCMTHGIEFEKNDDKT